MTRTLTLRNRFQGNTTIVENDFIDIYMAKANGEYVKVYLLLLRHLNGNSGGLSIAGLADCLECTEKDILRAFKYWSKVGLLKIEQDDAGNICGLAIGNAETTPEVKSAPITLRPVEPQLAQPTLAQQETAKSRYAEPEFVRTQPKKKTSAAVQDELRQLYFITEQYIGKPLTVNEIKKLNYFYDTLNFSTDLIEYLIEYCVENGHRNFRYIESVALGWSDAGVQSVEEAKLSSSLYNKNYFSVLNAFGIKGRNPAPAEMSFMKKWFDECGFSLEVILEACNRTIANTHKPDFKYTDSILNNWIANDVHNLSDVSRLDIAYQQAKESKKRSTVKSASGNRFNNFEGRSYDINSLEQQLLNTN